MKLLLYCTKSTKNKSLVSGMGYEDFVKFEEDGIDRSVYYLTDYDGLSDYGKTIVCNDKIVAECDFEVEEIRKYLDNCYNTETLGGFALQSKSCLDVIELDNYLKNKGGYAIHLNNLHIFDKPKKLDEYYTRINNKDRVNDFKGIDVIFPDVKIDEWLCEIAVPCIKLEKAPQNMQKIVVFNKETNRYEYAILISIRPEFLCKILNKEKTIEIRKKVLRWMI